MMLVDRTSSLRIPGLKGGHWGVWIDLTPGGSDGLLCLGAPDQPSFVGDSWLGRRLGGIPPLQFQFQGDHGGQVWMH